MRFSKELSGDEIEEFRYQRYDHERQLAEETYDRTYRRKDLSTGADVSELFHENTKADPVFMEAMQRTSESIGEVLPAIPELLDPDLPGRPVVALPDPETLSAPVSDVLERRESPYAFDSESISAAQLSTVLHYSSRATTRDDFRRPYPSVGALYPCELFVAPLAVDGLDPGLYYYHQSEHRLRQLETGDRDEMRRRIKPCVLSEGVPMDLESTPVIFFITADFWRAKLKYGPRGYRCLLQESGHLSQNILMTLTAMELGGRPVSAFDDDRANELLGRDGVNEATIYLLFAGHPQDPIRGGRP